MDSQTNRQLYYGRHAGRFGIRDNETILESGDRHIVNHVAGHEGDVVTAWFIETITKYGAMHDTILITQFVIGMPKQKVLPLIYE